MGSLIQSSEQSPPHNLITSSWMLKCSWDAFQQSAKETFRSLVNEEDFMDVTLSCDDDKQIKAHKVILSACSPFFKRILLKNPHPNPLLFISGVAYRDLKAILNFMYLGETNVEQSHLDSFMSACNIIKVKGLSEQNAKKPLDKEQHTEKLSTEIVMPWLKPSSTKLTGPVALVKSEPLVQPVEIQSFAVTEFDQTEPDNKYESQFAVSNFEQSEDFTSQFETARWSDGKFCCQKCDFQSGSKSHLKRHDEMKHQGIKYACDGCDYKASSKDNLKRHSMAKHEGVTFNCTYCPFSTSLKGSLRRHKLSMHSTLL